MGLIVKNSLFDLADLELLAKPDHPKQPLIEFKDDPVALACASYRYWIDAPHTRWVEFDQLTVIPQDRTKAEELKKYYRDRLMIEALTSTRNQPPSEFRQKLYKVITDCAELTQNDIGLLYRLPYFYQEDQDVDAVMEQTKSVDIHQIGHNITGNFSLIKKVLRSRKHGDYHDYWMCREGDHAPYLVIVKSDNPLNSVWNSLLKRPVSLTGKIWTKQHRGFHKRRQYYQLMVNEIM